jgi:hypothetical protein
MAESNQAKQHLDGWLLVGSREVSYYGLLDKKKLVNLVGQHGFAGGSRGHMGSLLMCLATRVVEKEPKLLFLAKALLSHSQSFAITIEPTRYIECDVNCI